MKIIVVARDSGRARQIDLLRPASLLALGALLLPVLGLVFGAGFLSGGGLEEHTPEAIASMRAELSDQKRQMEEAELAARRTVDGLASRLGQLNAHIIRLDALGRRLVSMADLEDGEFNFGESPAQGGPEPLALAGMVEAAEITQLFNDLDAQIESRAGQLEVLEAVLSKRRTKESGEPRGRPVKSGWLSSYFGRRTDPFTGQPAWHRGVDFAGARGSDILAVASGVVTWSGDRFGFGNMVEINHGNGLVTRYAHNTENLVEVGQTVRKGETIALMGSSGRSTGPHVHFEVLKHGKHVNPLTYVQR